jgi:hypothetical protein
MMIVLLSYVVMQETSNLGCIAKTKSVKPHIIKIGCVPFLDETRLEWTINYLMYSILLVY